MLYILTCCRSS